MMEEAVEKEYILNMHGNYSETVIDHARNPRNVGNIPNCDGFGQCSGECGDTIGIWLSVKNERITRATFWTDGCGATIACGSMITELVTGRPVAEAKKINRDTLLHALGGLPEDHVHCAALAADTLAEALQDYHELARFPWKKAYMK
ncbi:iron-sulfur cluster assembly scaffold protein [Pelotomaculum propionicicum]|uniref:Iron-sulfur cluster assembly scaffold protein IscU n=1 Tax=Pelotomaculum propionicicum TaxID=258475 RepID=A0A4Y7RQH4_9FIRM|nr:Iron-sulfur cluster assembly scaffold protein IscU [Pelotomaculum propionicicum]